MNLREQIDSGITAAIKAGNEPGNDIRKAALRNLKTAVTNKGIEKGHDLDDTEVLAVVASLVKQRRDSIEQFGNAGRQDLVDKETAELAILQAFLPAGATPEEIEAAVAEAIAETGATTPKDMGKVMKAVMPKLAGKSADGKAVNEAVRRKLVS